MYGNFRFRMSPLWGSNTIHRICYKNYAPPELKGNTLNDRKLLDNLFILYFSFRGA